MISTPKWRERERPAHVEKPTADGATISRLATAHTLYEPVYPFILENQNFENIEVQLTHCMMRAPPEGSSATVQRQRHLYYTVKGDELIFFSIIIHVRVLARSRHLQFFSIFQQKFQLNYSGKS